MMMGLFNKNKVKKNAPAAVDKRNRTLRRVSLISAVVFIAILLLFNILFDAVLGDKLKWDWSFGKMFSISDVTRELLDDLGADIQITGLYEKGTASNLLRIEKALESYVEEADGKVEVRYINMDEVPDIGRDLDPTGMKEFNAGTFIVKNMTTGRLREVQQSELFMIDEERYYNTGEVAVTGITAESAFSGAIKYVSAAVTPTVYALQGHKETAIETFPTLVSILTGSNNVDIKSTLNLMIDPNIPEDCALLVMINPSDDITPDEKRILSEYLQKGGDLMVLTEFNEHSFPRLNEVLVDFNIEITDDKVREDDVDRRFNEQPYTFVSDWPAGSLNDAAYNTSLLGVNARHIRILDNAKEWVKVEPLSQTGSSAVVEDKGDPTKISAPGVQVFSALCENTGWVSSNVTESSKVIVIGSVNMMSDTVLKSFNTYNGNQFYFSVNWLTDAQDTGLYIAEKPLPSYLLQKGTQTGYIFASVAALAIIPAVLLVVGLVVYRKRKNL
jgi:hypothetical protein